MKRSGPPTRRAPLRRVAFKTAVVDPEQRPQLRRLRSAWIRYDYISGGARAKVEIEGRCRRPGCDARPHTLQAAHLIPKEHDPAHPTRKGVRLVLAIRVIPLCPEDHARFDHRASPPLDVRPFTTDAELAEVVDVLGEGGALRRLGGREALNKEAA